MRDLVQYGCSSVAWYQPVKYSANGVATNRTPVTSGKESTCANRECSSAHQALAPAHRQRPQRQRHRGAEARNTGVTMDRIMCWIMCTLISVSS